MAQGSESSGSIKQIWTDFRRGPAILIVWLLAIGAVYLLLQYRIQNYEYVGIARSLDYPIASDVTGRIETLLVDLAQDVSAGQIIATLDDSIIAAQIQTAKATAEQLQAELGATLLTLKDESKERVIDWQSDLAELHVQEEKYSVDALNLKVEIEEGRAEEQHLKQEMERVKKLIDLGAGSQQEYETLRLTLAPISKRIAENIAVVDRLKKSGREASQRREQFLKQQPEAQASDKMLDPIRKSVRQQELIVEELEVAREQTILRAPVSGRVTQVLCRQGQAVTPGLPIVVMAERHASEIIAYIAEHDKRSVQERMRVHISRPTQPLSVAEAIILRVGNGVELLPDRLWIDPRRPAYGRTFLVSASSALSLLPGERVRIQIQN